jgi:thiol:disulfide interchange protein
VALAAWIFGEFVQRGQRARMAAAVIALLFLTGGYFYFLEFEMHWRAPAEQVAEKKPWYIVPGGIEWEPWNPEAVQQARADGRPVLVDFTAFWCPNCRVNKKTSIEVSSVREKLREIGAATLIGDFTRHPPAIAEELRRHGRAGVPLVLVYSPDTNKPPEILPEVLTPGIVLNALERASQTSSNRDETAVTKLQKEN